MTTAICFDLDGTLVHFDRPYDDVVAAALEEHGIEATPELTGLATEAFDAAFDGLECEPYRAAMAAVVEETGADADPDALVETLREAEYAATEVPDAAPSSLAGLAEDSALAVVTNGVREWQVGKLDHQGLTDLFDVVVASYEAGAHKPDAAPFDLLRERLPADEYVMVGDDYEEDVEGSRAAGFVPIQYENSGARSAPGESSGDQPRDPGPSLWATIDALL